MKLLFLLFVPFLFLPVANAQTIDIDYDNCMVISAPENFYWPFEVITRHDPAIAQRITDKHANAPNAQLAIDKPQTEKAEEATWISFKNSANQTANWEVQLDLEYLSESTDDREILIEMYSNNHKVANHKLFQDGKNFCIVYNLIVSNPPHEWTDEEIMAVSSSLVADEYLSFKKEQAKTNVVIGDASRFDNLQTLVLGGLAVALIVGSWKARDRIKSELKLVRWEREQLEDARMSLTMNDDYRNLKIKQGLEMMRIEKNRIYQDVIDMVQIAIHKGFNQIESAFVPVTDRIDLGLRDDNLSQKSISGGAKQLAKETFDDIIVENVRYSLDTKTGIATPVSDPSDPSYIPGPVEYDIPNETEKPTPGLKDRLSVIKKKLPFSKGEKTFEEYTEDYLYQEIKDFDSSSEKINHLKKLWDERIAVANEDPLGIAGREIEVIRKVWEKLLE